MVRQTVVCPVRYTQDPKSQTLARLVDEVRGDRPKVWDRRNSLTNLIVLNTHPVRGEVNLISTGQCPFIVSGGKPGLFDESLVFSIAGCTPSGKLRFDA